MSLAVKLKYQYHNHVPLIYVIKFKQSNILRQWPFIAPEGGAQCVCVQTVY